jgi:hypothetical protein
MGCNLHMMQTFKHRIDARQQAACTCPATDP